MPKLKPTCPRKTKNSGSPRSQFRGWKGKRTTEERICGKDEWLSLIQSGKLTWFICGDRWHIWLTEQLTHDTWLATSALNTVFSLQTFDLITLVRKLLTNLMAYVTCYIVQQLRNKFRAWGGLPVGGPTVWNSLPDHLRDPAVDSEQFRQNITHTNHNSFCFVELDG